MSLRCILQWIWETICHVEHIIFLQLFLHSHVSNGAVAFQTCRGTSSYISGGWASLIFLLCSISRLNCTQRYSQASASNHFVSNSTSLDQQIVCGGEYFAYSPPFCNIICISWLHICCRWKNFSGVSTHIHAHTRILFNCQNFWSHCRLGLMPQK